MRERQSCPSALATMIPSPRRGEVHIA
jgi:hypothetical protein